MLLRIDPFDTIQQQRIDNAIYDHVYNYTAPTDMKGTDRIVDIRPIGPRNKRDSISETFGREFDIKKGKGSCTVEVVNGQKTLRISKHTGPYSLLQDFDAVYPYITGSGDIATSSFVTDYLDYVSGQAAMDFTLSGATGIGSIIIQTPTSFDLTKLLNEGALFEWIKIPNANTRLTSIDLEWGSDQSNYWHYTATKPQGRIAWDNNAWDLVLHDWTQATQVGSPVITALTYFKITFNYTPGATIVNCKIDSLTASLGKAYEILYYSQNIFQDATTGLNKEIPTADSDVIQLDQAAFNIFFYEVLKLVYWDIQGHNMETDMQKITYELEGDGRVLRGNLVANRAGLYRDYIETNPSQSIPIQTSYYEFPDSELLGDGNELW